MLAAGGACGGSGAGSGEWVAVGGEVSLRRATRSGFAPKKVVRGVSRRRAGKIPILSTVSATPGGVDLLR